jgi:hypothetical protein
MSYPIGRVHLLLNAVMVRAKEQVRAELYISRKRAKSCLRSLKSQRFEIENEIS